MLGKFALPHATQKVFTKYIILLYILITYHYAELTNTGVSINIELVGEEADEIADVAEFSLESIHETRVVGDNHVLAVVVKSMVGHVERRVDDSLAVDNDELVVHVG